MTSTNGSAPFHPGTPWDLFRFEFAEGAGGPAVAEPAAPAGDPGLGGEPAAPPAWEGVTQEQWEEQQHRLAAVTHYLQQQAAQQQQAGQPELGFDPFGDDPLSQVMQLIDARIAPLVESHEQMGLQAGQELAYDVIADFNAREGDFLHEGSRELAYKLAKGFMGQAVQRFGYTDRAGEAALEAACKHVKQLEESIGQAYHERQTNQLATLAGARREPGAAGGATQIQAGPYAQGQRVTDRFFGRGGQ